MTEKLYLCSKTKKYMATVDDKKVIFSMVGVSKTIQQNQKQVLKNIYLSFFYVDQGTVL